MVEERKGVAECRDDMPFVGSIVGFCSYKLTKQVFISIILLIKVMLVVS